VIQAFVLFLLCSTLHPVLGFPTGLYPVGVEGRIHYSDESVAAIRRSAATTDGSIKDVGAGVNLKMP